MKETQVKNDGLGKFVDCGKRVVPVPDFPGEETKVKFRISKGLFEVYARQLHINLEACQGMPVPPLDDIRHLLHVLLYLRVEYVKGTRLPFSIRGTNFCIPAFFSQILTNIGRVESDEFGLRLIPDLDPPESITTEVDSNGKETTRVDTLTIEEAAEAAFILSRKLRPFFNVARVTYATELPRQKEGNISLMTLQVVSEHVKAESNRNEPIFALMAAVLCNEMSKEVVLPRIDYGALNYLRTLIIQVGDYERTSS